MPLPFRLIIYDLHDDKRNFPNDYRTDYFPKRSLTHEFVRSIKKTRRISRLNLPGLKINELGYDNYKRQVRSLALMHTAN